jgi:hypothetical protein
LSVAAIRTAIYSAVNGVTGIGQVYDYERWTNDWEAFLNLFKTTISSTTQIRGWEVAYRGFANQPPMDFSGQHIRAQRFDVMGYMGLDDSAETEKTFSNLAEDVADAIDAITKSGYYYIADVGINEHEPRMFGGVLCHYARLAVVVEEVVA